MSFYCKVHARRRHLAAKDARRGPPRSRHRRETVVGEGEKWCPDCSLVKPISDFVRNSSQSSGRSAYCKPCHNARGKASKEKVGGSRTYHLQRRYGITAVEADAMLADQGGLCAICAKAPAAHVDHDHDSGAVRSLLCFNCNGGLGQFKDDPALLRVAARYVESDHAGQLVGPPPGQQWWPTD
ncbi:endonuclease VII domain-containing protein [Modestobacter sp. VKM Ac-2984]|uniref:endonuclease VII domain-containing protein n=1 Tax=Modestobacter sp. VKM Ac-2984 TaxID=3004138 RepID=UPI0022AA9B06|nr:endonuclease VII domain-containing protein [Modestobacter sp. VKM Ac-2984]MCZ2816225.1 endonuclease VII domain-containing protein [Modestobacter sp. VKM Ac-2984]